MPRFLHTPANVIYSVTIMPSMERSCFLPSLSGENSQRMVFSMSAVCIGMPEILRERTCWVVP